MTPSRVFNGRLEEVAVSGDGGKTFVPVEPRHPPTASSHKLTLDEPADPELAATIEALYNPRGGTVPPEAIAVIDGWPVVDGRIVRDDLLGNLADALERGENAPPPKRVVTVAELAQWERNKRAEWAIWHSLGRQNGWAPPYPPLSPHDPIGQSHIVHSTPRSPPRRGFR